MRRFFSDAAFTSLSQFFSAIAALVMQVYVARTVPLEDYGKFAAIQAFVLLIEAVFVARGGEVAMQFVGHNWKTDMPRALWFSKYLCALDAKYNSIIYLLVVVSGFLLASLLNFHWEWLAVLALTIPAQIGYGVYKSVFVADGRFRELALLEIVCSLMLISLTLVFVSLLGIVGFIAALVASAVVKTLLTRLCSLGFWPKGLQVSKSFHFVDRSDPMFRAANVHSIVRNGLMSGASQGDILLLNALQGPEVAALYKVAKTVAAVPVRVVAPVWVVMRSRILSAMRLQNTHRIRQILFAAGIFLVFVGIVCAVPLLLYADKLMVLVFGDAYLPASHAALLLLLGTWMFGAVSGWLNFACVITSHKMAGTLIYFVWAFVVLAGGLMWGGESASNMATVAALGMGLASISGWFYFMRDKAWI